MSIKRIFQRLLEYCKRYLHAGRQRNRLNVVFRRHARFFALTDFQAKSGILLIQYDFIGFSQALHQDGNASLRRRSADQGERAVWVGRCIPGLLAVPHIAMYLQRYTPGLDRRQDHQTTVFNGFDRVAEMSDGAPDGPSPASADFVFGSQESPASFFHMTRDLLLRKSLAEDINFKLKQQLEKPLPIRCSLATKSGVFLPTTCCPAT
ncbi:MAG: hypothetical protein Q8J70_03725 [Thiobacillus sp.]|nr:hypothetical protein [Thiobacillus sp.]